MKMIYTKHAEEQIEKRKITKMWIEDTLKHPDEIIKSSQNKFIFKKKLNGRSIEVVLVKESYIKIITSYWV